MTKSASITNTQNMLAHVQHVLANQTASSYGQMQMRAKRQIRIQTAEYDYNPNVEPSWKIPLSELVVLWRAKFGDVWVDVSDLEEVFWYRASMRLSQNKLFEEGDTRDSTPWVRLKEDV